MKSLNPSSKLIGLLVPTLILTFTHNASVNIGIFGACVLLILISRVSIRRFCFALMPVLLAAAGMFFTGYHFSAESGAPVNIENLHITGSALFNGLGLAGRVLAFGGLGLLFVLTTDIIKLIYSLQQQLRLPAVFAYGLLAAWGMLPEIQREYLRTRAAFRSRGIWVFVFSPRVLRPIMVKCVSWAEAISIAMESKGFNGNIPRTFFRKIPMLYIDIIFPGLTIALAILAATLK